MLIEDGANPKEVMVEIGHSNIAMTYDLYGHLFTDEDADTRRAERSERLAINEASPSALGKCCHSRQALCLGQCIHRVPRPLVAACPW